MSRKLLNQGPVNQLLKSVLRDGPSSSSFKCVICTNQQLQSLRSFSALAAHHKHQHLRPDDPKSRTADKLTGLSFHQQQQNQHQQQIVHNVRLTSTTSATTAAATTTTNIKRDASTQAKVHQQQQVDMNTDNNTTTTFNVRQSRHLNSHLQHHNHYLQHQNQHHHQHHHHQYQRQHQHQHQQLQQQQQHFNNAHNQHADCILSQLGPQLQPLDAPEPNNNDTFKSRDLQIIPCKPGELAAKPSADKLLFGHAFTDHMFRVDWDHEDGWSVPVISKFHNLELHPGAKVFHYAMEAFEGAKAYRGHDNKIRFFRLDQNIRRLLNSSRRLSLPDFDENELIDCIHKLVHLEQSWIPQQQQPADGPQLTSLYIRPTIMGVEPSLGVARSKKSILYVLLSPVGPYFKTGFKPISLYADPGFVRAWPGGAGNTKLGANYASTIMVQKQAEQRGLQQVLWLFGDDMKLTEVGTMNVFVTVREQAGGKLRLITPPLTDGLILPGITRASILELARQWDDVVVEERYVTIGELQQLIHEERLVEMFGAGTACIVCPISSIQMKNGAHLRIPYTDITDKSADGAMCLTKRILKAITDIQYGRVAHPWAEELRF